MIQAKDSRILQSKFFSIQRAVEVFEAEQQAWVAYADRHPLPEKPILGRNFSQISRLQEFVRLMLDQNEPYKQLSLDSTLEDFLKDADKAVDRTRVIEFVWDYFREKLELRLLPQFEHCLWAADLIAHDCYTTVMDCARTELKILPAGRESPLPYLEPGLMRDGRARGAVTYRAGDEPERFVNFRIALNQSGYQRNSILPIAVIELPTGLAQNVWEFVVLGHEVTHDIDGDLNTLHTDLPEAIREALKDGDEDRRKRWAGEKKETGGGLPGLPQPKKKEKVGWSLEIFADLMALRLMGPAYARWCFQHLTTGDVVSLGEDYPSNCLRIKLMLTYLRDYLATEESGFDDLAAEADALENRWNELFGADLPADQKEYPTDFGQVIDALMNTRLKALTDKDGQSHTASELARFTREDWKRVEQGKKLLLYVVDKVSHLVGENDDVLRTKIREKLGDWELSKAGKPPAARHVVSAAYLAFEELLAQDETEKKIHGRLRLLNLVGQEFIKGKQPAPKLAVRLLSAQERMQMKAQAEGLFALLLTE